MNHRYDLLIRGGTIMDGTGTEAYVADIGVNDGRISAIGQLSGSADEEIDAAGSLVTPGFVDIHTHYDGQVTWENRLQPSSQHGVTTVVMGNCAIGFAPCRPAQRELLQHVIAGVEDIPETVMTEGLKWNWETFPEYMDVLSTRKADVDFAAQVPHSAVRIYVMGERGAEREPATAGDLSAMSAIVREGIEVGALGVSTSHTLAHRTPDGVLAPTETAAEEELIALAQPLKQAGRGVYQLMIDFHDLSPSGSGTFDLLRRVATAAGQPLSFLLAQYNHMPEGWRTLLDLTTRANEDGLAIKAQVSSRGIGVMFGLDLSLNPFSLRPSYQAIEHLPLAERVERMRDPALKEKILSERPATTHPSTLLLLSMLDDAAPLGKVPNYEPRREEFLGYRAGVAGRSTHDLAYDLLLEDDGHSILYLPFGNYSYKSLDVVRELMLHPHTIVALGDGGAHYGMIADAAYPTYLLSYWHQTRPTGERVTLSWAIKSLTSEPAAAVGLLDRGILAPGYKADINVIDLARLRLHAPTVAYDLPANGRRIHQGADGYRLTIVSGEITYRDGAPTDALPGRLIRGQQNAPAHGRQ
jgi:N-acyl-D-aspartate/D-glutamate deacylase